MKRHYLFILCVLFVFGVFGTVNAHVPPCSGPAAISGPDTVCEASTISLSDTTPGGSWSSSDTGIATVNAAIGIVTGVSGGTVTITYALPSGCFVTMPIVVNPIMPISGITAICVGASGTFSDLSPAGTWSNSNTTVATVNESTGVEEALGPGTTIISYTIPNGCSARLTLTVNPLPLNYYVFGGGDYCAGTSGVTVGLNGSDTGINYFLYNGTTLVDSQYGTGSAIFYGPYTAAGTYQIYGVNVITGCSNRMSGIAVVGVIPDNVPGVSITTGVGDTVCLLANTTFTAVPVDAGASPSYEWFVNGASVGGTGSTYSYVPNNGDVVSVIINSDAVCAIPSTATSSITMTTIPKVTPSVSISVVPGDTVCATSAVTIIPLPVYGGPAPTYRWIKNGFTAGTGPVYNYIPTNGDNIFCSIYSSYECLITDSAYSTNNINMTVMPLVTPTVSIVAHPGDTIAEWEKDTLVAVVTGGGPLLTYQWKINGAAIPGAVTDTFISYSIANKDTVSCIVTSLSPCNTGPVDASVIITDTLDPLGVLQTASRGGAILVVPNPNRGIFTVNGMFNTNSKEVELEVADILGQTVYKSRVPIAYGKLKTQVALGDQLANGVYLIRITAGDVSTFSKFILSR